MAKFRDLAECAYYLPHGACTHDIVTTPSEQEEGCEDQQHSLQPETAMQNNSCSVHKRYVTARSKQ